MMLERSEKCNDYAGKLRTLANWTLGITGSLIFLTLSWYAMCYTRYIPQYDNELPVNNIDSPWRNLLVLLLVVMFIVILQKLERYIQNKVQVWIRRMLIVVLSLWFGLGGLLWITSVDRVPVGDQAFIYGGASYFIEGGYDFLEKGAYCDMCPHQLGLMALVELLFRVVGTYNYFACQLINVGLTVGIILLGYLLVKRLSKSFAAIVVYCVLMSTCLPLMFYTGWI